MPSPRDHIRNFVGQRWINILLRACHIAGVAVLAGGIMGDARWLVPGAVILLGSGLAMFALDLWSDPHQIREVAGLGVLLKLALAFGMTQSPTLAPWLFWLLVLGSTVLSHAPRSLRHRVLLGPRAD